MKCVRLFLLIILLFLLVNCALEHSVPANSSPKTGGENTSLQTYEEEHETEENTNTVFSGEENTFESDREDYEEQKVSREEKIEVVPEVKESTPLIEAGKEKDFEGQETTKTEEGEIEDIPLSERNDFKEQETEMKTEPAEVPSRNSVPTSEEYEQRQFEAVLKRLRLLGGNAESKSNEQELEQKKGQFLQEQQSTQQQEPQVTIEK